MKNIILTILLLWLGHPSFAQFGLPHLSPKAGVSATVGLTKIEIDYSSPAVRGREIWGNLVPWDQVWRAGANMPTVIMIDNDVRIGGKTLPKGSYAFFIIPKAKGPWTVIFNTDHQQWGAYRYDEGKDMVRVEVEAENTKEPVEYLRYAIENYSVEKGAFSMVWEKKKLTVPFSIDTKKMALANIAVSLDTIRQDEKWLVHGYAAEYHLMNQGDPAAALKHSSEAVKLMPNVWGYWIHARVLAWNKKYAEALAALPKMETASHTNKDETFYYNQLLRNVNAAKAEWISKR